MHNVTIKSSKLGSGRCTVFGATDVPASKRLLVCFAETSEPVLLAPRRAEYSNMVPLNGRTRCNVDQQVRFEFVDCVPTSELRCRLEADATSKFSWELQQTVYSAGASQPITAASCVWQAHTDARVVGSCNQPCSPFLPTKAYADGRATQ
jgi:hypothetical protein